MQASPRAKDKKRTMKIGFQGRFYPRPSQPVASDDLFWQLEQSASYGCTVLQAAYQSMPDDDGKLEEFREQACALGIELEITAPGAFAVAGPHADADGSKLFRRGLEQAERLQVPVVRTGYGKLNVKTSRFNHELDIDTHLRSLVPSLQEAAKMAEASGVLLAVENHCDFTGKELARLLDMVDSPYVGAALDTANGFTVFCDPNDDVDALAPYTFTTHMKDMMVIDYKHGGNIPMLPRGCVLGKGHVDLPRAVEKLAAQSPCAEGLHLIVEPGWMLWDDERNEREQQLDYFAQSIAYLQSLIREEPVR